MVGGKVVCINGIYVDDLLITEKNEQINDIINRIKRKFKISKYNHADYLLGIRIESGNHKYSISQEQLIEDILQKFNIKNTRKVKTPCTEDDKNLEEDKPFDKTTYQSAIGALIYLGRCTRPDISFAVGKVSRNSENPKYSDWKKGNEYFKILKIY